MISRRLLYHISLYDAIHRPKICRILDKNLPVITKVSAAGGGRRKRRENSIKGIFSLAFCFYARAGKSDIMRNTGQRVSEGAAGNVSMEDVL